jgi:D-galactarolactone cycloisomerase
VLEFDQTPHPIRENLTDPFFTQSDSRVDVPTAPGLGVEVDESILLRFTRGDVAIVDQPSTDQPFL